MEEMLYAGTSSVRWVHSLIHEISDMSRAVLIKSLDRPPSDSTTNVTPTERRTSFEYRAWPGVKADSSTIDYWSGEITWTSRAAGLPPCQVGRKMSAGLDLDSGIKPLVSRAGLRAADWAAENKTSRIALSCLHFLHGDLRTHRQ